MHAVWRKAGVLAPGLAMGHDTRNAPHAARRGPPEPQGFPRQHE
jgi:hypothetical protein